MAKLTLDNLSNLNNATSAISNISTNNDAIETALENTLSRDGTAPNEMNDVLDMNSNQIINLPTPSTDNSPVRVQDLQDYLGSAGGSSNLGLADQAQAEEGASNVVLMSPLRTTQLLEAYELNQGMTGEIPQTLIAKVKETPISPEDFGAVGDGVTNDYVALQACITEGLINKRVVQFKGKTYLTNTTLTCSNPGATPYTGPQWEGIPYSTCLKAGASLSGPIVKFRGIPPADGEVATTYFRGGRTKGILFDGNDLTHNGIEIIGVAYHTFEKLNFEKTYDGIKADVDLDYGPNQDYSANQNCLIQDCVFLGLGNLAFNDFYPLGANSFELKRIQTLFCYGGGVLSQSTQLRFVQSGIAYSGFKRDLTANPDPTITGLQIGDLAGTAGSVQDVFIDQIEFDENKDFNVRILGCNRLTMNNTRHIYGNALGTDTPTEAFVAIGNGITSTVIIRIDGMYIRCDHTGALTALRMDDSSRAQDVHISGLNTNNAGGATITTHSGFTDADRNFSNDLSITDGDGVVLVPGKTKRIAGGIDKFTVAAAPTPSAVDYRLGFAANGDSGAACLCMWNGSAWFRIPLGAQIAAS